MNGRINRAFVGYNIYFLIQFYVPKICSQIYVTKKIQIIPKFRISYEFDIFINQTYLSFL